MINISLHIRKLPPATVGRGGRGILLKSNTQSAKICLNFNFRGVGGGGYGGLGVFWNQISEQGVLENLVKNLPCVQKPACVSQMVSHILRMWRLINCGQLLCGNMENARLEHVDILALACIIVIILLSNEFTIFF